MSWIIHNRDGTSCGNPNHQKPGYGAVTKLNSRDGWTFDTFKYN